MLLGPGAASRRPRIEQRELYTDVKVHFPKPNGGWWLDPGWTLADSNVIVPTISRALPRAAPPNDPAGFLSASDEAINRWSADEYALQVY